MSVRVRPRSGNNHPEAAPAVSGLRSAERDEVDRTANAGNRADRDEAGRDRVEGDRMEEDRGDLDGTDRECPAKRWTISIASWMRS